jgi:threonine dehydrogenase-like Zn-dependent dehydrogenase
VRARSACRLSRHSPAGEAEPIIVSDYKVERRELARDSFGAHILVDPAQQSPFDVWREVRADRGLWGPAVVFECVGVPGLIQDIVESVDMGTRIYCAGGWYTGDSLNVTDATRQGVTIQFGGGLTPKTGTELSTPSQQGNWTRCPAWE